MEVSDDCCVKVAVHIRPFIGNERLQGCTDCVAIVPGKPQVQIGSHSFTFDHVYGSCGSPSSGMFEECIAPLVDGLFQGYNATVLAYGQTGSGKTYTMGTGSRDGSQTGLIPQVMNLLFDKIEILKHQTEFQLHVSFIEILKEEVRDLLDPTSMSKSEATHRPVGKVTVPGKSPIQIRETSNGAITLEGSTEVGVSTLEQMVACLEQGSLSRATGSTNMNNQSSRSHGIFTITLEQMHKVEHDFPGDRSADEDFNDEYLCAKLHLVDLAGSERAKRTGSDDPRFKEGVHINKGLLALGNVISALGDEKKRKEGAHVPYRDSKLTRILQDSLGGNNIACVSPADINVEETLNTLKYANRARNIKNKPIVNRDPVSSEMQKMRQQLEYLQTELLSARGGGASSDEVRVLKERISCLEAMNEGICKELREHRCRCMSVEPNAQVLQRKTEEASMATKRLNDLLEPRKSSACNNTVCANGNASSCQQRVDHELEVKVNVHEVRFEYEKQSKVRAAFAEELALLKEVDDLESKGLNPSNGNKGCSRVSSISTNARIARISSLENMMSDSSSAFVAMASQLSEVEEREHTSSTHGHLDQLSPMDDEKNVLQYMFTVAADARRQLWEKEIEIEEMEAQVNELISILQQSEARRKDVEKRLKLRDQADSTTLDSAPSGISYPSLKHSTDDTSRPPSLIPVPEQKQLKFTESTTCGTFRNSAAFLDHTLKMIPVEQLSMGKKIAIIGQPGRIWKSRSHNQWLLQFKWKWPKPWKLSEWIRHSDETIVRARPRPQALEGIM